MREVRWCWPVVAAVALLGVVPAAHARIKLITLPPRERVEIQLDNPAATLVEEERIVPLVKGENQVDFSWANTQINPDTIVFRVIAPVGDNKLDVKVLSVSYPPNEAALVWSVGSSDSGSARVRISYILGNLNKSFTYRAVASRDETTLTLAQYMRLQNLANEEYGNTELWAGFGKEFLKPIGMNETKEMLVATVPEGAGAEDLHGKSSSEFGYIDQPQNKLRVPMHYVIKNDKANNLAPPRCPTARSASSSRAPTRTKPPPSSAKTGATSRRSMTRCGCISASRRTSSSSAPSTRTRTSALPATCSIRSVVMKYEIENFKDQAVTLDIVESLRTSATKSAATPAAMCEWELGKDTTFDGGPDKEKSTFDKLVFHVKLPARGADGKAQKFVQKLHVMLKNEW